MSDKRDQLFLGSIWNTKRISPCCLNEFLSIVTEDTDTIDFSGRGTVLNPLTADVIVSSQSNNLLTALSDGLYVGAPDFSLFAKNGTTVISGFIELGGVLLHDTTIDLDTFDLFIDNVVGDETAPSFFAFSSSGALVKRDFRVPLNILLPAEATNTINSGNYTQEWQWNNMSNAPGWRLSSTSSILDGTVVGVFEVYVTGSNASAGISSIAGLFYNGKAGVNNHNIAFFAKAEGGLYNTAGIFAGNTVFCDTGTGVVGFARVDVRDGDIWLTHPGNSPRFIIGDNFINPPGAEKFGGILYDTINDYVWLGHARANPDLKNMFITTTGSVGIGGTTIAASSILQLNSTTQAFVPPRMTAAQKNAIPSPQEGSLIYQTDGTKGWYGFDGLVWIQL